MWQAFLIAILICLPLEAEPLLQPGRWDPYNRQQLEVLLGQGDPQARPYAVFDWDNTSIFSDVEEAALAYQLQHLVFGMKPEQLRETMVSGVPEGLPGFAELVDDIVDNYGWLYLRYEGFSGQQSLQSLQSTPQFGAFTVKLRYLYGALEDHFGPPVAFPWVTCLFRGLTPQQVRHLGAEAVRWQLQQPVGRTTWTSPAELPGRAGVVSVSWNSGMRTLPEMQDLYRCLRKQGFEVWVCTASQADLIREFSSAPEFGYLNPDTHVLGIELELDEQGRYLGQTREGHPLTFGKGKTEAIERFLVPRYGHGPALVAGDTVNDQDMMQDFADTQRVLIVHRSPDPNSPLGQMVRLARESYAKPGGKYLLQGRDDSRGGFLPSQEHLRLKP